MAIVTNTSPTYSVGTAGGNREDLEDTIHELYPEETFFTTNLAKVSASATYHEWLGDTLDAAASNIHREGNEFSADSLTDPIRYANYTQIIKKAFLISGTQEVVAKAGRASEIGRQAVRQMRAAKNDLEYAICRNQAATAGGSATGRSMASMETWIGATTASSTAATQVVRASSTASSTTPPFASGAPGTAPTDSGASSLFALVEGSLKLALESNYAKGSTTDVIAVNATAKNYINAFTGVAQRNVDVGREAQAPITGAADLYVANFGVHKVVLHRHVRANVALCLDTDLWAGATLRPWALEERAKTGDAEKREILCEKTLVCRNPKGNSKVTAIC